jgi:hypothetical protein
MVRVRAKGGLGHLGLTFYLEVVGGRFSRNVDTFLPSNTLLRPRIL